ncbi:MAG: substrate-binding domain-containing protein [Anaerolineae bacterium]|nr:substrate-binding domain-containing protein [Anaerolineae bacterium]
MLLIIPDIANPFFPLLVRGVQDIFEREKFAVIVGNTDRRRDRELEFLDLALRTHADGLIINPSQIDYADLLPVIGQGIAVVLIGTHISHPQLDVVRVDNRAAAHDAVAHLVALGHRRIGMVCGPLDTSSAQQRREGYERAMQAAGLPIAAGWIAEDTFDETGGYRGTQRLLALPDRPTAIFATADLMALGVLGALRDAGLSVPGDVSVVGFDDIPSATITHPPLTTIHQPTYEMGQCAAERLMARIKRDAPDACPDTVMAHRLVVRASTGPPATT